MGSITAKNLPILRQILGLLCVAPLLLPLSSWGQQTSTQQQPTTPSTHHRSRGSGGGGGSSRGGNTSGVTQMKELPCPKGFTAQTDSGPHLHLAQAQASANSGRRKPAGKDAAQMPAMKNTMARRCVPDKPKKATAASRKMAARTP
jgi:hypothetical protein